MSKNTLLLVAGIAAFVMWQRSRNTVSVALPFSIGGIGSGQGFNNYDPFA